MSVASIDWPPGLQSRVVNITQGEFEVSNDPGVVISTILGSCISVCLFDAERKAGGMNHYLLVDGTGEDRADLKYGAHSIELLINRLLRAGATRENIKGKIFGGASMSATFSSIGANNAAFALDYLKREGFEIMAKDVGGSSARRVNFHPATGQARVTHSRQDVDPVPPLRPSPPRAARADVTLF